MTGACLASAPDHLTFYPGYSLTVASETQTHTKKPMQYILTFNRRIAHEVYHRKSELAGLSGRF